MSTSTCTNVIFPWHEKYSVGIPEIDIQHKGLTRLINDLHAAMATGQGIQAVGKILDELVHYTQVLQGRGRSVAAEEVFETGGA